MGFTMEVKGLDAAIKRIDAIGRGVKQKADKAMLAFANDVVRDAKATLQRSGTSNNGQLANSIHSAKTGEMRVTITVGKHYGAFIEFGTRKYAQRYVATLPQDWQAFAAKFKGGGQGTFDELVLAIYQWVRDRQIMPKQRQYEQGDSYGPGGKLRKARKKKKSDKETQQQQLAYAIAVKIVRHGIRAQPYLYPNIKKHQPALQKLLRNLIA
jgi:HK97 gp10 family phage protein